MRLSNIT